MKQEKSPLTPTEIALSLEYELENKPNTEFALFPHCLPLSTPPPLTLSLLPSTLPLPYTMSQCGQINYKLLAQQQQKQLVAL